MAGCSDPDYKDSTCPRICGDQGVPDIVYQFDSASWSCCGQDSRQARLCNQPAGRSFNAPAPGDLASLDRVVSTDAFSALTTASTTASARGSIVTNEGTLASSISTGETASPIPTTIISAQDPGSSAKPSTGLGTGAAVGLTIGIIAFLLLLIGSFLYLFYRRRVRRRSKAQQHHGSNSLAGVQPYEQRYNLASVEPDSRDAVLSEMAARDAGELGSEGQKIELPGDRY